MAKNEIAELIVRFNESFQDLLKAGFTVEQAAALIKVFKMSNPFV